MQIFKPSGPELEGLRETAAILKAANEQKAFATKASESAKKYFAKWLLEQRQLNLDTLAIGERVHIEGAILIKIGRRLVFDENAFSLANLQLYLKFRHDTPVKNFEPLV